MRVIFHARVGNVHEANLIEDAGAAVQTDGDGFVFDLKPFEVKTFKLMLTPAK